MTSHLCRFCFPSLLYYGQFESRISFKRLDLRRWLHISILNVNELCSAHLSLKLPKILLGKLPFKWFALFVRVWHWWKLSAKLIFFVESDSGPPTSIGESDLDGVGLGAVCCNLCLMKCFFKIIFKNFELIQTNLDPGDGVPSLLPEHDWWLMLFDKGRSFSDSILGLEGATLELRPSSSSKSASPVTFGEDVSLLSPSIFSASLLSWLKQQK